MLQRQFQAAGTLPGDKNNNNELLILNLAAVRLNEFPITVLRQAFPLRAIL